MIELINGDCLSELTHIDDHSIDAIICDPPYGTTSCDWDKVIPFDELWSQLKRVIKPNGAIILFSQQPFSTDLIMSNRKWFKYQWVWQKNRPSGVAQAKNKPMAIHEDILVFSEGATIHKCQSNRRMPYNPQGLIPYGKMVKNSNVKKDSNKAGGLNYRQSHKKEYLQEYTNYPNSILNFASDNMSAKNNFHPTQKPVALLEYLIKTYTDEGQTVLDFTMGSGSCGVACGNTNRNFTGIELNEKFFKIAENRINSNDDVNFNNLFE